jgi:flagella basal body P-ring formation protein FlgA
LGEAVDAFLAGQPRRAGETWKWELVRAPEEIKVPAAPHTLEMSFAGARRKGKIELTLSIRSEGRTLRSLPVSVNLRVEELVLVAKRAILRDEPLTAANVSLEMRETTQMNDLAMANPERLFGRLAKAGIQPGRVITPRLVALPPAVRRGQEAKMVYRNGDVNITAGAVCRQDGVPGQIITAKSLVTQRLMRVRVTENGLLEPVPGG